MSPRPGNCGIHFFRIEPFRASRENLIKFTTSCQNHITGDEKSQAQIFLDRLFQAIGLAGGFNGPAKLSRSQCVITWKMP